MGSHSRHRHHHHCPTPVPAYCSCCGGCNEISSPHPPPAGLPLDPLLLQSITTALLHQQQNYQQHHQCFDPCCFQPSRVHTRQSQTPHSRTQTLLHSAVLPHNNEPPTHFHILSLHRRLDALESSLRHLSLSEDYPLRDAAARVIQTHFRAFLVRRSRTLRQLKDLASLKSAFNSLTASVSGKPSFKFELVSQKAMDLLLKLDSIQSGDPMIKGAKRSMSRDLVKFLELVDSSRKRTILYKSARKVRPLGCGNKSGAGNASNGYGDGGMNRKEIVEKLRHRVGKINNGLSRMTKNNEEGVDFQGLQYDLIDEDDILEEEEEENKATWKPKNSGADQQTPRLKKKSVSFAENENVYTVLLESPGNGGNSLSPSSDEEEEEDDDDDVVEHYSDDEVEASMPEANNQNEEALSGSGRLLAQKGKNNNRGSNVKASVAMQEEGGSFFFSAPVPAKMESRASSTDANSAAKNVS